MKQGLLALVFSICLFSIGSAQAFINAKIGVESWMLKDEAEAGQSRHPGQIIGFDVYVEKNRALFVPGFHYHRISIHNEQEQLNFNLGQSHHIHYFTIPLTVGYKFIDHPLMNISAMAGGEITFFYDLDLNNIGLDDDMLYGVSTGLTGIVQTELFSFLTAEIKYHYALQPIIKIRPESKLRGLTFAIGVKF